MPQILHSSQALCTLDVHTGLLILHWMSELVDMLTRSSCGLYIKRAIPSMQTWTVRFELWIYSKMDMIAVLWICVDGHVHTCSRRLCDTRTVLVFFELHMEVCADPFEHGQMTKLLSRRWPRYLQGTIEMYCFRDDVDVCEGFRSFG